MRRREAGGGGARARRMTRRGINSVSRLYMFRPPTEAHIALLLVALNRAGGRRSGTVAGDLPIASLGRDALTRPPPSPRGGSLPWVSAAAASSSWVSCRCRSARRGGRSMPRRGLRDVRRETPARRKTHAKIGSTTGGRGSRDARFACRPRVARAGTTVTATSRKRLRSRAGLLDARATHLVLYVSDVVVDVRLLQQRLERLALGPARASHRRARPVLVPPSHRAPVETGVDGEVVFVQSRGRHRACALRSAPNAAQPPPKPHPLKCFWTSRLGARDPLAARLGKPSRFREPLARTP